MKNLFKVICTILMLSSFLSCSTPQNDPGLVSYDFQSLCKTKQIVKENKSGELSIYKDFIKKADSCLGLAPEKVTDGDIPPSADKHDFYAIGKYSWPNPNTPDGMPYIRIDCQINPEAKGPKFDLGRYNNTVDRIKVLSFAWFYSQDEKYARKATDLLRVWFTDKETKMNPHFEFASALPGVYNGMAIGIIFGVTLVEMVDCVKLLATSESWTEADNGHLKQWFSEYVKWLVESDFGKKERKARNNHGSWYSAQIAAYSLYTGETAYLKEMAEFGKQQINEQVAEDGSLPKEITRDWAFSYSVYGMRAFTVLASCADHVGVDLWNYKTQDGRSLYAAYTFLASYLIDKKSWEWGIVREDEQTNLMALPMMRWASQKYNSPALDEVVEYLLSLPKKNKEVWLLGEMQ